MRPRIHPLLLYPTRRFVDGDEIKCCDSGLSFRRAGIPIWTAVSLATLSQLSGATFRWKGETGMDGVQFGVTGATIVLSGWQCKCSALTEVNNINPTTVKVGNRGIYQRKLLEMITPRETRDSAVEAAVATEEADSASVKKEDNDLYYVTTQSEWGFLLLARAVLCSVPEASVSLGKLVITTTRGDGSGAHSELEKFDARLTIPEKLVAAVLDERQRLQCEMTYKVALHCGDGWLLEHLEPALRHVLPKQPER